MRDENITITLDEQTAERARLRAAEQRMSLARYIEEVLRRDLCQESEYEAAYRAWSSRKPFPLKGPPRPYPKREELYDRAAIRREDVARRKRK